MNDLNDYDLQRTSDEASWTVPRSRPPLGLWIALASFVIAIGIAGYLAWGWPTRPAATTTATSAPTAAAKQPPPSLGGNPEPITLPPLDASDAVVRMLVQALSESPAVTAWLTTDDLIRNFTIVVANIAGGTTPAKQLKVVRPASTFSVIERDRNIYIDPRSYARYATLANAFASLDPVAAARLYGTLKPRIEEAHRELGSADPSFDRTLERAISVLLETPILDGPVRLVRKQKGIGYAFADERLEKLTGAQRQLLRMGPEHVRVVLEQLRRIGSALGIPAEQLRTF
jgi:hypothetical protein